jgi:phosphoribosylformimino-5-aminoimidazole carboxamide ribotide isomerase
MLIPSIDLMGGKIVQLVQGDKKALEFDNFEYWIERFSHYPLVQVIDLDAARGVGSNRALVYQIARRLNCQVGGGIRSLESAREVLDMGAGRVILGSALLEGGRINTRFAAELASALGSAALVFALDSRAGRVAIDGWRTETDMTAVDMIRALEPFCGTFLYTHIDTEGLMGGIPMDVVTAIRHATLRRLIVAGGITTQREIDSLDSLRMDAVVGMALYCGRIAIRLPSAMFTPSRHSQG